MGRTAERVIKIVTSVIVALIIVLAFLMVGVRLFGLQVYSVLSGSMEPEYRTGSLIYVKEVPTEELEVNDVITFRMNSGVIATHRIIEIVADENEPDDILFRTKGDANNIVDAEPVKPEKVLGTPVFSVPHLGILANYIQQPPGLYIAVAVSACIVLAVLIVDIITDDGGKKPRKKKQKSK